MSKGLPELSEQYKSESSENDEKKLCKDLAHRKNSGTSQDHNHQNNHKNDPPDLKKGKAIDSLHGLSSTTILNSVATALGSKKDIQKLCLCKTKDDILKYILSAYIEKGSFISYGIDSNTSYRSGNNNRALNANGSIAYNRIYENFTSFHQRGINHTNAGGNLVDALGCLVQVHHASKQNDQQDHFLLVDTDGEGDGDPAHTKLITQMPLGRSSRYLMELKNSSREIHDELTTKGDNTVDFSKAIKPRLEKLSWREKCEENKVDITTSEEEEDIGLFLALANLLYCSGETGDILDITYGFADDMQHFVNTQAVEAEESQDDNDDDEDSVANDSGSEAPDDGGIDDTKGITIEVECNSHSGNRELVGTDRTIPNTDYWERQSQLLTGNQFHQSETHRIKHHHLLTNNGSNISMTTEVFTANLTVDATLQDTLVPTLQEQPDDNHVAHGENNGGVNDPVEQAPEPPPVNYPSFEQSLMTVQDHSLLKFPQVEDQPVPLSDEVESSTEDYVDAVEAQPEDDLEENEDHQPSSFVSSSAENVDDEAEVVHMMPKHRRRWLDCCLL